MLSLVLGTVLDGGLVWLGTLAYRKMATVTIRIKK